MGKEQLISFRASSTANRWASELAPARYLQRPSPDSSPPENQTPSTSAPQTTGGSTAASGGSLKKGSNPTAKTSILQSAVLTRRSGREKIAGSSKGRTVEQTLDTENAR